MLFSTPYTFVWDAAIALPLAAGTGVCVVCAAHLRSRRTRLWKRIGIGLAGLAAAACTAVLAYGTFVEPQLLTVTRANVPMPLHAPLKVAVLSDLHVGPYKGAAFIRRAVDRTNALMPDIVLLAGDYLLADVADASAAQDLAPLKDLHPVVGTFAVLGNHDHGLYRTLFGLSDVQRDPSPDVRDILGDLGIQLLDNQNVVLEFGVDRLAVAGVDDRWVPTSDVGKALEGIPENVPVILLAHNPDVLLDPRSASASLIVAGHTHGGQVRLPWIGPVPKLPTRLGRVFDQGLFGVGPHTTLAITRGIGESGPRVRLFAPPEIMLLQLTPEGAK